MSILDFSKVSILLRGAVALLFRQGFVQVLGAITGVVLARTLEPGTFGVYAICTFLFSLLLGIGDLGYGAALIRQSHAPSLVQLRTCLFLRQCFDAVLLLLLFFAAPFLAQLYELGADSVWSFRLIGLAGFVSSFQVVPTVLLERKLRYSTLATIEVGQSLLFSLVAISMILLGWGALSFGVAWLCFALFGALSSFWYQPWEIGWSFWIADCREKLRFGIPFQAAGMVVLARDAFSPIAIGLLLGTAAVGFCNWALMLATFAAAGAPILQRLCLAALAPLLGDRRALQTSFAELLFIGNAVVAPIAVMLLVLAKPGTAIVFGEAWLPALPLFYVFWGINLFLPSAAVVLGYCNATGRSSLSFRYTCLATLGMWGLGLPLLGLFGTIGYASACLLAQLVHVQLASRVSRELEVSWSFAVLPPWLASTASGALVFACTGVSGVQYFWQLIVFALLGGMLYLPLLYFVRRFIESDGPIAVG